MQHTCSTCKKEYKDKRRNRRYCSRKCFFDRNKHWTWKECLICHKTFKTYPNWINRGGGKFCSKVCVGKSQRKRIERECELCGTKFSVKPCALIHNASRFCNPKCAQLASRGVPKPSIRGENAPNWKGGIQFEPYPFIFNDELKTKIRKRDDYTCQSCGMVDEEHIQLYGYHLVIHHIDYVKSNCSENNLVTVCIQCNSRANFNREHWVEFFCKNQEIKK